MIEIRKENYVPETIFGKWFLRTETWVQYVLEPAIEDLSKLAPLAKVPRPCIVDVGCGCGRSFEILNEVFQPHKMIGLDIDANMLEISRNRTRDAGLGVSFHQCSCSSIPLSDQSVDIVFCHQTFHHFVEQEKSVSEFFRILRPGGVLLFAESTRAYIHSWIIRLLFRHPMEVQKSAEEYIELIRSAGFDVPKHAINFPYLWWSRPDLALGETVLKIPPSPNRVETLVNLAAIRPIETS